MPEKKTIERARRAKREGKAPSTQAGAFVKEEIERVASTRRKAVRDLATARRRRGSGRRRRSRWVNWNRGRLTRDLSDYEA